MELLIEQIYRNNKNYKGIVFLDRDGPLEDVHMMIGHLVSAAVAAAKHQEAAPNGKARKNKAIPFYLE